MDANNKQVSLQVIVGDRIVFESYGKWLYPLFELETWLQSHPVDMAKAELRDKVIGKAAALLMVRLGVRQVHGAVMSSLACDVFKARSIPFTFDECIKRIDCQTEIILKNIDDVEEAYQILRERAGL